MRYYHIDPRSLDDDEWTRAYAGLVWVLKEEEKQSKKKPKQ